MVKSAGKGSKGSPSRGGGRGQGGRGLGSPTAGRQGGSITPPLRHSPRRGSSTPFRCRSPGATRRPLSLGAPSRMPASGISEGRSSAVAVGVAGNNYNVVAGSSGSGGGAKSDSTSSTCVCPECGRDLRHPKALYGHMRWHSTGIPPGVDQEGGNEGVEAQTAAADAAATAAATVLAGPAAPGNAREEGEVAEGDNNQNKAFVVPDLNLSPPTEEE